MHGYVIYRVYGTNKEIKCNVFLWYIKKAEFSSLHSSLQCTVILQIYTKQLCCLIFFFEYKVQKYSIYFINSTVTFDQSNVNLHNFQEYLWFGEGNIYKNSF